MRSRGLVVSDKAQRVANFQQATVENVVELLGAAGLESVEQLEPKHINHRVHGTDIKTYEQLYPCMEPNALLSESTMPDDFVSDWRAADPARW